MISFDEVEIDRISGSLGCCLLGVCEISLCAKRRLTGSCNGESDLLPSLIVDRYNDCFVIQTLSQGMDALKQMWIELLVERYNPRAIVERNEARVRELEGLPRTTGVVYGSDPGELVIEENEVRLTVNLVEGQKTGAFLDQRENRVPLAATRATSA